MSFEELVLERIAVDGNEAIGNVIDKFRLCDNNVTRSRDILVGRQAQCDLRLDSKNPHCLISRQHAKLKITEQKVVSVEDLKSVNGTYVNNVMLKPYTPKQLNIDDTITFGCVSPNTAITPGTTVVQENALFKYILKESQTCQSKTSTMKTESKLTMSFPSTPVKGEPLKASTPQDYSFHCELHIKDELNRDSGILRYDYSTSNADSNCQTPKKHEDITTTPKLQAKFLLDTKNTKLSNECNNSSPTKLKEKSKTSLVPLTVSNLLAFSGCKFKFQTEIQSSSCGKENLMTVHEQTPTKNRILPNNNSSKCQTGLGSAKKKRVTKRKQGSCSFTKKKRAKREDTKNEVAEVCSFFECKIRNSKSNKDMKVVSWVQCDSCDKWFHTECVGCDYNKVKLRSHQFQCGLC